MPDPDPGRLFIVGCPRSGTTWVRELVSQHPDVVASTGETALFTRYLRHLDVAFQGELSLKPRNMGYGLAALLSQQEFDALLRSFAEGVLGIATPPRPGCRLLVEKTPGHVEHAPLILRLFPEASFLHVIRDPREVFCSSRAARSWSLDFYGDPVRAARYWRSLVSQGRAIGALTPHYAELRYERLLADGPSELGRLFGWLGLPADAALCETVIERCRIESLRKPRADPAHPPPIFFRRGEAEGWRRELTRSERSRIERVAGPLMTTLGYERSVPPARFQRVRRWLRPRADRLRSGLDRRLRAWIDRI
jgi:Sulfotransferase family